MIQESEASACRGAVCKGEAVQCLQKHNIVEPFLHPSEGVLELCAFSHGHEVAKLSSQASRWLDGQEGHDGESPVEKAETTFIQAKAEKKGVVKRDADTTTDSQMMACQGGTSPTCRWWTEVKDVCPMSGFPVNLLPYPPFKFQVNCKGPKENIRLVDGPFLVLQVLTTWQFEALGRPLTKEDINQLDAYMKRCKLGPFRLSRALEMANQGTDNASQELQSLRVRARRRLEGLKHIQRVRLNRENMRPPALSAGATSGGADSSDGSGSEGRWSMGMQSAKVFFHASPRQNDEKVLKTSASKQFLSPKHDPQQSAAQPCVQQMQHRQQPAHCQQRNYQPQHHQQREQRDRFAVQSTGRSPFRARHMMPVVDPRKCAANYHDLCDGHKFGFAWDTQSFGFALPAEN